MSTISGYAFYRCSTLKTITFLGDAPYIELYDKNAFEGVTAVVYYPSSNPTWDLYVKTNQQFGGKITWAAYNPNQPKGDVDGDGQVGNSDLIMVARYVVEIYTEATKSAIELYGDMNGDGQITNQDIITIARKIVGLA